MRLGQPRRHLATVDSTNAYLKREAAANAPHGLLVTADSQSAGYGQRGRTWVSEPGCGLYFSLLLPVPAQPTQLPFVVGLGCHDALAELSPGVGLKWVNDLVADGRKLGGMLVELTRFGAIAGIGLNLTAQPVDEAISLAELLGGPPDGEAILERLLEHLQHRYDQWLAEGFTPILEDWTRASVTLGREVQVLGGDAPVRGLAEQLGPNGELLLRQPDGRLVTVITGTVRRADGAYC